MNKPLLLVANWKMNLRAADSLQLAQQIIAKSGSLAPGCELWLAPSFTSLPLLAPLVKSNGLILGAQNAHWSDKGAFTGEISVPMLLEQNVSFVIVGHSERRHVFGESDNMVVDRAKAVLNHGLNVIFCVGEKLEERERGQTLAVLEWQLAALLDHLEARHAPRVIVAYEPVWAIGTGRVADSTDIETAHTRLAELWKERVKGARPRILYGGSVNPQNFAAIKALESVDGALVGGASLDAGQFLALT